MRLRKIPVLLVLVLAGAAVALELAARSTAAGIARALSPRATLTYASAGIALDGSVRLRSPRLEMTRGIWRGVIKARNADLRGDGRFWLVPHALASDPDLPADFSLRVEGLRLESRESGEFWAGWLGAPDLALFENQGCGDDALSDKDRARMGVEAGERVDRFSYHHDRESGNLSLGMDLSSAGIANWKGYAEFSAFDAARWSNAEAQQKLRLRRAGVSYTDPGYFSRRNKFCADWLGVSSAEFVDRHVQATQAFLEARGIDPGADVMSLYERLVTRGGSLNLASLPEAGWVPAEFEAYPRQVLLRQLNVTARLDDAPPIMLRLAFSEPEIPLRLARAEPQSSAEPDPPEPPSSVVAAPPAEPPPAEPLTEPVPAADVAIREVAATPAPALEEPATVPAGQPPTEPAATGEQAPAEPARRIIASAPPPPADSTLALVWQPGVIERLPAAEPKARNYDVIALDGIGQYEGRRVQLVTEGGKRVNGIVDGLQPGNLVLRVEARGGNAKLNVPLSNIREVRLLRAR